MNEKPSSPPHSIAAAFALLVLTSGAAVLRFYALGWPSLWLDEILNVGIVEELHSLRWWKWIAGFESENGPLYFALQWLVVQMPADVEFRWRFAAAVVGTLSVPLAYTAASTLARSRVAGLCAAFLVAVSPYHVYYSREGRTYALLFAETLLVATALAKPLTRRRTILLIGAVAAACYTAATAAPLVGAVAVVGATRLIRGERREALVPVAAGAGGILLIAILYLLQPRTPSMAGFVGDYAQLARDTLVMFTSSTLDALTVPRITKFLVFAAVIGAVVLLGRGRAASDVGVILPIVTAAATLLALFFADHWYSPRYLTPVAAILLMNAGIGIWAIARGIGRLFRRPTAARVIAAAVGVVIIVAIGEDQLGLAMREPYERADWRGAAEVIAEHSRPGDVVVTANMWSWVSLRFYLRELAPGVVLRELSENVAAAEAEVAAGRVQWLVSAGALKRDQIRWWMCGRFHLALADAVEDLRVYFVPGERALLSERFSSEERAGRMRDRMQQGVAIDVTSSLLGDGWYGPEWLNETPFRWTRDRASIDVPSAGGEEFFNFEAMGVDVDAQRLTILTGGTTLPPVMLARSWRAYAVRLPAIAATEAQRSIEMRFDPAIVPASRGAADRRLLGAAFRSICVSGDEHASCGVSLPIKLSGTTPRRPPLLFWRRGDGTPDEEAIRRLLIRAGVDTRHVADVVERRDDLQRLVKVALLSKECTDEGSFVDAFFNVVLERQPDDKTRRLWSEAMRGEGRPTALDRLMRSREFRRKYFTTEGELDEASVQRRRSG